ncbi:MAG: hypothetical protein IPI73_02445 [Betaproteobacteria bacterium]|nr:hypothetical protein [Betaproteobacteria bacterium]
MVNRGPSAPNSATITRRYPAALPPHAPPTTSPQPESPVCGNAFPLRVVEREGALFDVEDRRIAFAADSQRLATAAGSRGPVPR